jgi:hypothetical protein
MKRTTREWVRKAESDFRLASRIARGAEPILLSPAFDAD